MTMPENEEGTIRDLIPRAGSVSTRSWIRDKKGEQYQSFWSSRWSIVTDKEAGLAGIKTSDKWAVIAFDSYGKITMIIPGCEVSGYAVCEEPPDSSNICNL